MKILLITRNFSRSGGIARYTWELTKQFLPEHEVHLLTSEYDNHIKDLHIYKRKFKDYPLYLSPILHTINNSQYAKKIVNNYDIDVSVSNRIESYKADIITMHNCHKAWINRLKEMGLKQKIREWFNPWNYIIDSIEKKAFKNAEIILTVSQMVKKELLRYYELSRKKIKVVRNGVAIDKFKSNTEKGKKIRDKYDINKKTPLLLFVGQAFKRKGLDYLIKAIPKIKNDNVKLLIVGRKQDSFYHQLTNNLNVEKKVIFTGFVPDIQHFYQAVDIFILPSLYDPYPLVNIEAMASGLPIITSKNTGTSEIIKDGKNGLLLEKKITSTEIANKVNFLLSNPKLMQNIGQNARNTVKEYSWDKVAKRTLKIYKKALKK